MGFDPGTIIAGVGAAVNLGASIFGASSQSQAANQQAGILETNAGFSDLAAGDSLIRGRREAALIRMRAAQILGEQKVAFATSGIAGDSGSAAELQAETRMMSELDVQTTLNNAAREAWGYKVQSYNQRESARLTRKTGQLNAAGTILGGVARAAADGSTIYSNWKARQ